MREAIGRPMEILLVEDCLWDARLTIDGLAQGQVQHRLTLVRDGAEALEFLYRRGRFARAPRPDLILLDLDMPVKDGRELLRDIKGDDDLDGIPIVVLTASRCHEDRLRSQQLQVDSYLTKPVDFPKFIALVRELKRFWLANVILPAGV